MLSLATINPKSLATQPAPKLLAPQMASQQAVLILCSADNSVLATSHLLMAALLCIRCSGFMTKKQAEVDLISKMKN
jgi:hypothetical protein